MPILTKDGKEYRTFSEPNPLASDQEKIEKSKLEFHNFEWKKEIKKADSVVTKAQFIFPKTETIEEFIKEIIEEPKPEEPKPEEPKPEEPKPEEPKPEEPKPEEPKPELEEYVEVTDDLILIVHVLPVYSIERIDELYGEIRKTNKYGDKFNIESILMEISDLSIQILSDVKLEKNFIIYPSRYKNGENAGINRWWRVINIKQDENGNYLIQGIPSDFHPDFSIKT
jgi:hypothetical protein